MNKQTIHNILSSIQMSSRDKKDLVNAIANSGGINEQTPIKESLDGTELVPIFDGENKAINVNELIKSNIVDNTTYIFNYTESQTTVTQDEYDGLKNAIINRNKIMIIKSNDNVTEIIEPPIRKIYNDNIIIMTFTNEVGTTMFAITNTLNIIIESFPYVDLNEFNDRITTINNNIADLNDRVIALERTTA